MRQIYLLCALLSIGLLTRCGNEIPLALSQTDDPTVVELPINYVSWTPSSIPADGIYDERNRGRLIWYNPYDGMLIEDIWADREAGIKSQNKRTDILVLELASHADRTESWDGLLTAFYEPRDLSQGQYLEIWVRGDEGMLHLDMGMISEDANGDARLNTEDIPFRGRAIGDGVVSTEEDIGIDGRGDYDELNYYLTLASVDTTGLSMEEKREHLLQHYPERNSDDPEGDNWHYDPKKNKNDYSRINGTEGNKTGQVYRDRPDTEELNRDAQLTTHNDYYHYSIDLASDPHVAGTEHNGWRQYRLPLYGEEIAHVGTPDSSRVEFVRLMISGRQSSLNNHLVVDIAQIRLKLAVAETGQ